MLHNKICHFGDSSQTLNTILLPGSQKNELKDTKTLHGADIRRFSKSRILSLIADACSSVNFSDQCGFISYLML